MFTTNVSFVPLYCYYSIIDCIPNVVPITPVIYPFCNWKPVGYMKITRELKF